MIGYTLAMKWVEQIAADGVKWLDAKGKFTAREREAYEAGLRAGARDMITTLKMHNAAAIDYTR